MQRNEKGLLVQFGCGFSAAQGWRNFDASPTLRFERLPVLGKLYSRNGGRFPTNVEYGDIVKGLPVSEGSCSAIFASHVLEHLSLNDFQIALRNTFALLQPGGLFRLVVPDLKALAKRYVDSSDSTASVVFMRETSLGVETRNRNLSGFVRSWLGNSSHLWMWDLNSLTVELERAGFTEIREASCGDEQIFKTAEEPERFIDSIAVQARRPLYSKPVRIS